MGASAHLALDEVGGSLDHDDVNLATVHVAKVAKLHIAPPGVLHATSVFQWSHGFRVWTKKVLAREPRGQDPSTVVRQGPLCEPRT